MTYDEIEVTHKGKKYFVTYRINSMKRVDDSYDGHRGGEIHTFSAWHDEIDDFDVLSVCDEEGDEIDPSLIHGLDRYIDRCIKDPD